MKSRRKVISATLLIAKMFLDGAEPETSRHVVVVIAITSLAWHVVWIENSKITESNDTDVQLCTTSILRCLVRLVLEVDVATNVCAYGSQKVILAVLKVGRILLEYRSETLRSAKFPELDCCFVMPSNIDDNVARLDIAFVSDAKYQVSIVDKTYRRADGVATLDVVDRTTDSPQILNPGHGAIKPAKLSPGHIQRKCFTAFESDLPNRMKSTELFGILIFWSFIVHDQDDGAWWVFGFKVTFLDMGVDA